MNRFAIFCGFAIAAFSVATEAADPPCEQSDSGAVTIPLDTVWAYKMPGTRDVRELEPEKSNEPVRRQDSAEQLQIYESSLTSQILQVLNFLNPGETAEPGFVVSGSGIEALRNAHAVLAEGKHSLSSFDPGSQVTLVFFGHESGYYVHLDRIECHLGACTIYYRLVPHETKEMTRHFALIPLGKIEPGDVKVELVQLPLEKHFVDAGFKPVEKTTESRIVCRPFNFRMEEN